MEGCQNQFLCLGTLILYSGIYYNPPHVFLPVRAGPSANEARPKRSQIVVWLVSVNIF